MRRVCSFLLPEDTTGHYSALPNAVPLGPADDKVQLAMKIKEKAETRSLHEATLTKETHVGSYENPGLRIGSSRLLVISSVCSELTIVGR